MMSNKIITEGTYMKKDLPILNLAEELDLEDIGKVNGGTAFTAGNYNYNYHLSHPTACIDCLEEGYFTGREREDYYFFEAELHFFINEIEYRFIYYRDSIKIKRNFEDNLFEILDIFEKYMDE